MIKFWSAISLEIIILLITIIIHDAFAKCGATHEMMNQRSKRFLLHSKSWPSKNITYRISKYSRQLTKDQVDNTIRKAFDRWSSVTDLSFTQLRPEETANIDIRFEIGQHGDNQVFGPGNALAHGFYAGDIHFDDDDKFSVSGSSWNGYSLFAVAVHEIGHSLGLRHSENKNAIMAPYYDARNQDGTLHQDDINGIQEIYGKKSNHFSLNLCENPVIDTIFTTFDGKFFLFKGDHYYQIKGKSLVDGPRLINETWIGLPSKIEAAFYYPPTNRTYFFKDSSYWRFSHTQMEEDYPRLISSYLPGISSHLDDAMVWDVDQKLYFFKGSKYQRIENEFAEDKSIVVTNGNISSFWNNIPNLINAAFTNTDNIVYFFKDDKFYEYLGTGKLEDAKKFKAKSYLTVDYWFNCPKKTSSLTNLFNNIVNGFTSLFF